MLHINVPLLQYEPYRYVSSERPLQYNDNSNIKYGVYQTLLLNVDIEDMIPLSLTCKTASAAFTRLSICTLSSQFKSLQSQLKLLTDENEKNKDFPHNYISPEKSQTYVNLACDICKKHTDLINTVRLTTNANENKPFSQNEIIVHNSILNFNIPHDIFTNILECAINDTSLFTSEEDNNNLQYLAKYLNYPNEIARVKQPWKNIFVQLSIILIFLAFLIPGLCLFYVYVPSGDNLKSMTTMHGTYKYITTELSYSYPYVQEKCVDHYGYYDGGHLLSFSFDMIKINGSYEFVKVCQLDNNYISYGNITACINSLESANLNITHWANFILNKSLHNNELISCNPTFDNKTVTCGFVHKSDDGMYFRFTKADYICQNQWWSSVFIVLIIIGIICSTFPLWGLFGYFGGRKYDYCIFAIGFVIYGICISPSYIMALLYYS